MASADCAEVGRSLSLIKTYSLSRSRASSPKGGAHAHFYVLAVLDLMLSTSSVAMRQRLAAARSRHGSDSPPDCHSLPCRHCATLKGKPWSISADFTARCGHRALLICSFIVLFVGCDDHIAPWKFPLCLSLSPPPQAVSLPLNHLSGAYAK